MDYLLIPQEIIAYTETVKERFGTILSGQTDILDYSWQYISQITWPEAIVLMTFGVVCLLYGWHIFKALIVVFAGLGGGFLGYRVGEYLDHEIIFTLIGAFLFGLLSFPLMKLFLRIICSVIVGLLMAGLILSLNLEEIYVFGGLIIGIVLGAIFSYMLFKTSIIGFTSLTGASMMTAGVLGLINSYIQSHSESNLKAFYTKYQFVILVCTILLSLIGFALQNRLIKKNKKSDKDKSSKH